MPNVAIVCVFHNESPWLCNRALRSATNQTLPNNEFEVLAYDDSSTSLETQKVLKEFEALEGVKLLRSPRRAGLHRARLNALEAVTAPYVVFLDGDDALARDALDKLMRGAEGSTVDLVFAQWWVKQSDQVFFKERHQTYRTPEEALRGMFRAEVSYSLPGNLFRTELLRTTLRQNIRDLPHVDDVAVMPQIIAEAGQIRTIPEAVYLYDRDHSTITARHTARTADGLAYAIEAQLRLNHQNPLWGIPDREIYVGLSKNLKNKLRQKGVTKVFLVKALELLRRLPKEDFLQRIIELYEDASLGHAAGEVTTNPLPRLSSPFARSLLNKTVFICQADYHVTQVANLQKHIDPDGGKTVILDFSHHLIGGRRKYIETGEESAGFRHSRRLIFGALSHADLIFAKDCITFNDFNPLIREAWEVRNCLGLRTIAIVEGVMDYTREDSNSSIPYRASDLVLTPGKFDLKYFDDREAVPIGYAMSGKPEARPLRQEPFTVAINVNFTYGVLTDVAADWVSAACEVIKANGWDAVFTQHPGDELDLSVYGFPTVSYQTAINDADALVSRFSNVMVLALHAGKPLVYFNPHGEKATKFQKPLGAYSIADTVDELNNQLATLCTESEAAKRNRKAKVRKWLSQHVEATDLISVASNVDEILKRPSDFHLTAQLSTLQSFSKSQVHEENEEVNWLIGPYHRDSRLTIDEVALVSRIVPEGPRGVMVDVGANRGQSATTFLKRGFSVLAIEPLDELASKITTPLGVPGKLIVEKVAVGAKCDEEVPFYTSTESTGIGSLLPFRESHELKTLTDVVCLKHLLNRHGIDEVEFLKVDAEGWDLFALQGLDWKQTRPKFVAVEFDDGKTSQLGYRARDLAEFLENLGYQVWVSEWHPIEKYGLRHEFRGLYLWSSEQDIPQIAWGNLVAFDRGVQEKAFRQEALSSLFSHVTIPPTGPSKKISRTVEALSDAPGSREWVVRAERLLSRRSPLVYEVLKRVRPLRRLVQEMKRSSRRMLTT